MAVKNETKILKSSAEAAGQNDPIVMCVDNSKCSCDIELIWSALTTKCLRCGGEV